MARVKSLSLRHSFPILQFSKQTFLNPFPAPRLPGSFPIAHPALERVAEKDSRMSALQMVSPEWVAEREESLKARWGSQFCQGSSVRCDGKIAQRERERVLFGGQGAGGPRVTKSPLFLGS